jgi:hypothetical protein
VTPTAITTALLFAATAHAQATGAKPAPKPKRAKQFLVGGLFTGPSSVGSASAELLNGAGTPSVTLFDARNKIASGFGIESNVGVQLASSLWFEVSGGFTRANVNTEISNDFENADALTISSAMSRFTVEGGVVMYFNQTGSRALFFRGTGGWMRETAGGNTLTGDGYIASAGIGFRQWFGGSSRRATKRVGVRIEGRAVVRSGGISLAEKGVRFGPAGAVHLVFGL